MKIDNLVELYQEIFRKTTNKIQEYNNWYCKNFNNDNALQYNLFDKFVLIGYEEYIFIDKKSNNVCHYNFELISLQEHFNILSIIEHNIEDKIFEFLSNIVKNDDKDFEITSGSFKAFKEDLTTEEQIKLYETYK
jgi:hypothetical protein